MPRQARLDIPGTLHHVNLRGIEKRRIFDDDRDCENFVERLGNLVEETETKIYAWSLLTNHAHLLLRSGPLGLPKFMRRFLTGYAVTYNLRHFRHGHLFQNRYHSIVCDEDVYFRELVRYIHLNPLRARLVSSLWELDRYPWCGHAVLMGRIRNDWQDRDYVLSWFGKREPDAQRAYWRYLEEGANQGRRPELIGGGVLRSYGGWSAVLSLRKSREKISGDQRILGSGDFVKRVWKESGEQLCDQFSLLERNKRVEAIFEEECQKGELNLGELRMGGRRGDIPRVRSEIAQRLVKTLGMSLAEVARLLGVSTSAISKMLHRSSQKKNKKAVNSSTKST
jgi:REP element-mobilizing transposase RayT